MDFEEILALVNKAVWEKTGRNLRAPETVILKGTWQGLTYEQMSKPASEYSENYLMRDVGRDLWKLLSNVLGEDVNKSNFRYVMQQRQHTSIWSSQSDNYSQLQHLTKVDWGDAPDTSVFYGREKELETLQQWIVKDNCNLVFITGLAKMGKTFLVAKLVEDIQNNFDYVIWRSLGKVNFQKVLEDWFYYFYPDGDRDNLLKNEEQLKEQLRECLRKHKCLLIIDDIDEMSSNQQELDIDRENIITTIAAETHNSCLLVIGKVIPQKINLLIAEKPRINRLISLARYTEEDIEKILHQETLTYNQQDVTWLYEKCLGIPKSLTSRLQKIKAYCNNNIATYRSLTEHHTENNKTKPTDTISEIITKIIFSKLSETAQKIIYFLYKQKNKQAPIDKIFENLCAIKSDNKNKIEELKLQFWNALEELQSQHEAISHEKANLKLQDVFIEYLDKKNQQNEAI